MKAVLFLGSQHLDGITPEYIFGDSKSADTHPAPDTAIGLTLFKPTAACVPLVGLADVDQRSRFGVRIVGCPLQLMSPYPISSAKITTIFGRRSAGMPAHAPHNRKTLTIIKEVTVLFRIDLSPSDPPDNRPETVLTPHL
jgi:hypothetical protein